MGRTLRDWFLIAGLLSGTLLAKVSLAREIQISERVGLLEYFPCDRCHSMVDNKILLSSEDRHHRIKFGHTTGECLLCHANPESNQLSLLDKSLVPFEEEHKVCVQCHGEKGRDWERGVHGKLVGSWNRTTIKLTCTECHDPHKPQFPKDVALPPPILPKFVIRKGGLHGH